MRSSRSKSVESSSNESSVLDLTRTLLLSSPSVLKLTNLCRWGVLYTFSQLMSPAYQLLSHDFVSSTSLSRSFDRSLLMSVAVAETPEVESLLNQVQSRAIVA